MGGANEEEEETEPREKEKKMSRKEMKKLKKQVTAYRAGVERLNQLITVLASPVVVTAMYMKVQKDYLPQ